MLQPFFDRLSRSRRVLIAGCGGGFDVVSAIPLYIWLRRQGATAFLANLSFSDLSMVCRDKIGPACWVVDGECGRMGYFPERHLVDWLAEMGESPIVFAFERTGVKPLSESYRQLTDKLNVDTIVLVDGGTDSILKGNEALLGTPEEDAASIAAVHGITGPVKLLACIGFGIDMFHGVCHHSFLENTSDLIRSDAFLGVVSVLKGTAEGDAMLRAVDFLNERQPGHKSIVANAIASAIRGRFGDWHDTDRTAGSEMFVNPLMSLMWCYDLPSVATGMEFLDVIQDTTRFEEVRDAIYLHHSRAKTREWKSLPL